MDHRLIATAIAAAVSSTASAAVVFDFESLDATINPDSSRQGFYTELNLSVDGLDLRITREQGVEFDIFQNSFFFDVGPQFVPPASWGDRSLDPFFAAQADPGGFIFEFSEPIIGFSVDFGDFGQDSDEIIVQGFADLGLGGGLVDQNSDVMAGNDTSDFTSGTVAIAGEFRSVLVRAGGVDFPSSVFLDNIRVTPVPAPGSAVVLTVGAMAFSRRRHPRG